MGLCGQVFLGCFGKEGSCDQQSFLSSTSTVIPLDASSAGFGDVSTYHHWVALDWSNIAETWLATKIWNLLSLFSMYWRMQVLSVQKVEPSTSKSSSRLIIWSNLVAKTAADNSILGIVIAFRGANIDFAMTKESGLYHSRPSIALTWGIWEVMKLTLLYMWEVWCFEASGNFELFQFRQFSKPSFPFLFAKFGDLVIPSEALETQVLQDTFGR